MNGIYDRMGDEVETLRVSLWRTVGERDMPTFAKLCMDHEATIERSFIDIWRIIPQGMYVL
jgi:hypothetical protein